MTHPTVRRRPGPFLLASTLAAAAAAVVVGCDKPTPTGPDIGPPTTGPAASGPATAPSTRPVADASGRIPKTPGFAVGRITGADGKPIALKGARVEVRFKGSAEDDGRLTVGPDGTYARELKGGRYLMPTARIEFPFNGNTYSLPLTPANPNDPTFADAADGIVRDFVWKLSGPREAADAVPPSPQDPNAWIGGTVFATYEPVPNGRPVPPPPTGSAAVFTFTPKGPLADGSTGKPIVVERKFDLSRSALEAPQITDVPLGWWVITAVERLPDGRTAPLVFHQKDGKWTRTIEGSFDRNLKKDVLLPIEVQFTRAGS